MSGNFTSSSPWSRPAMSLTVSFICSRMNASTVQRLDVSLLRSLGFLRVFLRLPDDHVIALGPGNRAPDQQNVFGVADLEDLQVLGGAPDLAHVSRHFQTAPDRAGEQTAADRAAAPVPALRAVRA